MPLLDLFFTVAVPFLVIVVVVAKLAIAHDRKHGIYRTPEGELRRDEINRRYRTNRGAAVIAVAFLGLWGLTAWALVEKLQGTFFAVVVSGLLLVPFAAVCAGVIALYMFGVHGYAKARSR